MGRGDYRLQPIYVDDLATLAVEQGQQRQNAIIDAIGPETFSFRDLVEQIGRLTGRRTRIISVPPWLGCFVGSLTGHLLGDVVITRDEITGLMAGLLCVESPPTGTTKLTTWVAENVDSLGSRYASELARRRDRQASY